MSNWLSEYTSSQTCGIRPIRTGTDRWLRRADIALALLALAIIGLPYLLARGIGAPHRQDCLGLGGRPFQRLRLLLPDSRLGRVLAWLGAEGWPVVMNILRAEMAWVGPSPRLADAVTDQPPLAVPPGLVCLWDIRRRTAVDFGGRQQAEDEYLALRGVKHDLGVLARAAFVSIFPPPRQACPGRVRICDVEFDNVDMAGALDRIEAMMDAGGSHQVSFVNPACVNIAARERGYRRSLARAALVLPDGIGTKIAADILGTPLRQNVNGTDLFPRLCDRLEARGARLYLLGGQPGVPQCVASEIAARWPRIQIVGVRDGFFGTGEEGDVAADVRAAAPDVLLVARGAPAQDVFIDRYLHHLGARVSLGVGGLFDFVSGRISRAPRWMRDTGLEWVYRLIQEPRRMWERYLIGNFTFLGRVMLQRLRLRRPRCDAPPVQDVAAASETHAVAVLFATAAAAPDVPVAADYPACLLPYGPTTFVARCMAQLAQAGIRSVHIVAGTRPELLREALGQGEAWGLHLTWHLVKDAGEEVRVLRQLRIRPHQSVLIGRAHRVLSSEAFARLSPSAAAAGSGSGGDGHRSTWAGWASWASLSAESLCALKAGLSGQDVDSAIRHVAGRRLALRPGDVATADTARHLLAAQAHALRGELWRDLSDPVIPMPWGAMSPRAHVSPSARIQGPVWIGPGCTVGPRAELAANSVLTRDVMLAADTRMDNALALPETLIGRQLDLVNVIANGCSIQHVALGERIELRESDAVLSRLHAGAGATGVSRLAGRTLAAGMLPVLAPALGLVALTRWLGGQDALPWMRASAVSRCDPQAGIQKHVQLRLAREGLGGVAMAAAAVGALLDILQGRRCWMGPRPRKAAEWACLPNEWQAVLGSMPIGWLHMEAWTDSVITAAESRAAADLMWLAPPRGWKRLAFVVRALPRAARSAGFGPGRKGSSG